MSAKDANNAKWFMLRYEHDFTPRSIDSTPQLDPKGPSLESTLLFDAQRHVLELRPKRRAVARRPSPLPVTDVNGEVYTASPETGQVLITRCDGSIESLVCEPNVLVGPMGIAIDVRGLIYVADPVAHRVVVLRSDDGTVRAVLADADMREPVDVAIGMDGCAYVADRAGRIFRFSSFFKLSDSFPAGDGSDEHSAPQPVAVTCAPDGSFLVIDANHPRVLRFTPEGHPLPDLEFRTAKDDAMLRLPSGRAVCPHAVKSPSMLAVQRRLSASHRRARLDAFRANGRFETRGVMLSAFFDSHLPGTQWHRIELGADIPEGTSITVETATSNSDEVSVASSEWRTPSRTGSPTPFTSDVPEQLIQSGPGRYLRLRLTLRSDGAATPAVRRIRILYPRVTYLDDLPVVYRRDADAAWFLERFLALFERVFTGIEDRYELFSRQLNPAAAPGDVLSWLACLLDLAFEPSWPLHRRRLLVSRAMELYRIRGTARGIEEYVEVYTGVRPLVRETFLERPVGAALLGRPGGVLGTGLALHRADRQRIAEEELFRLYAHRFTVSVYLNDECEKETVLPIVRRIVETTKPAHTHHDLIEVYPDARVELQSTVGVDLVLGSADPHGMRLHCPTDAEPVASDGTTLGISTVLGSSWPTRNRETERRL